MRLLSVVVGNTGSQLLGKGFTAVGTILIMGLVDRAYAANGLGVFTLASVFLAPFYLIVEFGLNPVLVRQYTKDHSPKLFGVLLVNRFLLGLLGIGLALPLAFLLTTLPTTTDSFPKNFWLGVVLLSPALITYGLYQSTLSLFQWKLHYRYSAVSLLCGTSVTLVLAFLAVRGGYSLPAIFLAYTVGSLVTALVSLGFARTLVAAPLLVWSVGRGKQLILSALPFAITLVCNTLYFRLDSFILSAYHGVSTTGYYNAAYAIFANVLVLPTFVMNALYPILLRVRSEQTRYRELLRRTFIGMAVLGLLVMLAVFIVSPWFIRLWLKESAPGSFDALRWLLPSTPVFFLSAFLLWVLVTANKLWWLPWIYLGGMVVNITGNLLLVPSFGYRAAGMMTGISELTVLGIAAWLCVTHKEEVW